MSDLSSQLSELVATLDAAVEASRTAARICPRSPFTLGWELGMAEAAAMIRAVIDPEASPFVREDPYELQAQAIVDSFTETFAALRAEREGA